MTNAPVSQLQPSTADALRDAHASFLGPAYDRSIFLEAAAEIASLKADNEQLRKALDAVKYWATSECPCENDLPDPCPLCGARADKDKCMALEGTLPKKLRDMIDAALSPSTPEVTG